MLKNKNFAKNAPIMCSQCSDFVIEERIPFSIYLGSHTVEYEVDSEMVSNRFLSKRVAVCSRREGHDFKKVAMVPRGR